MTKLHVSKIEIYKDVRKYSLELQFDSILLIVEVIFWGILFDCESNFWAHSAE